MAFDVLFREAINTHVVAGKQHPLNVVHRPNNSAA